MENTSSQNLITQKIQVIERSRSFFQDSVRSPIYWNDKIYFASGNTIKIWNEERVQSLGHDDNEVLCLCIWKDSLCSTAAMHDRNAEGKSMCTIKIWNSKGKNIQVLSGHSSNIVCLAVFEEFLCSGSCDSSIKVWNQSGNCLYILIGHKDFIACMAVANSLLFSGSNDKTIRIWNLTGNCINILDIGKSVYSLVVWNSKIVCGLNDGEINVIKNNNWKVRKIFKEHTNGVSCLLVWKDFLFSGSSDTTVKVWDQNLKCIQTIDVAMQFLSLLISKNNIYVAGRGDSSLESWKCKICYSN
jgi:WD40 repeat protein